MVPARVSLMTSRQTTNPAPASTSSSTSTRIGDSCGGGGPSAGSGGGAAAGGGGCSRVMDIIAAGRRRHHSGRSADECPSLSPGSKPQTSVQRPPATVLLATGVLVVCLELV